MSGLSSTADKAAVPLIHTELQQDSSDFDQWTECDSLGAFTSESSLSHSPSEDHSMNMAFLETVGNKGYTLKLKNICCVGAGYVGGPTAAIIAFQNPEIHVTVVDLNAERIRKWRSRHLPIHEPGLRDIIRVARDGTKATKISSEKAPLESINLPARLPNLFFTTEISESISEADVIFLSVNTPTKLSGIGAGSATDLFALEAATATIAESAKPGAIIVEKSTVPCRTASRIRDLLEIHRPGVAFEILSNPEFLAEGSAIKDLLNPDRVLIGSAQTPSGQAAAKVLMDIYATWVDPRQIILVNLWSSELTKLAANAMLAQRISSINTISAICERTGANIDEVAHAVGLDPRLGSQFLKAGLGFGGSCFKKDILSLIYLSKSLGLQEVADYWQQVLTINDFQRTRFVNQVISSLHGTLINKKVTLLGYAFKNNTSDMRESPASDVVKLLLADRPREIAIFDPRCNPTDIKSELKRLFSNTGIHLFKPEGPIEVYSNAYDACKDASAALILTEWQQFRYPQLDQRESALYRQTVSALNRTQRPPIRKTLSELDIVAHQKCMISAQASQYSSRRPLKAVNADPLNRYVEEPSCAAACIDCARGLEEEKRASENLDWAQVCKYMQKPKWVFDGRGLVDMKEMEKLGFRVEGIGKTNSRSRLHGYDS